MWMICAMLLPRSKCKKLKQWNVILSLAPRAHLGSQGIAYADVQNKFWSGHFVEQLVRARSLRWPLPLRWK